MLYGRPYKKWPTVMVLISLLALTACGNKGKLYQPAPAQVPVENTPEPNTK